MFDVREEIGMRSWRVRCGECTEEIGQGNSREEEMMLHGE